MKFSWITSSIHHVDCVLLSSVDRCTFCTKQPGTFRSMLSRKRKQNEDFATGSDGPKRIVLERHSKEELISYVKSKANHEKALKQKIRSLEHRCSTKIKSNFEELKQPTHETLLKTLENHVNKENNDESFQGIFLRTQLEMLKQDNLHGRRWHPLVVQFCLMLRQKSASAYEMLRESQTLQLPSQSTLLRHNMKIGSSPGFQDDVFRQLVAEIKPQELLPSQQYFSIVMDEMKISENLVFKKSSGDLIGYTQLNETGEKLSALETEEVEKPPLASHVLMLMLRGTTTSTKVPFAYFATHSLTTAKLSSILWEAVTRLEMAGFKILMIIGDGAATNRSFFNQNSTKEFPYKCINKRAFDEERYLYFVFDAPHLIKTARNCFSYSTDECKVRKLYKNGQYILGKVVQDVYHLEQNQPGNLKMLHKISYEHVYPTSYSRMRVRDAVQVMSASMAIALEMSYDDKISVTVKFIRIFNDWFDMVNVRDPQEGWHKQNRNLDPYESTRDWRLKWLRNTFLGYLEEWEKEVADRPGDYTKEHKKKMVLSQETMSGLKQTTLALLEIIPFLLNKGAKHVLTRRFNQDPIEQEFSHHRRACGAADNPTLAQFSTNVANFNSIAKTGLREKFTVKGGNTTQA